MTTYNLALEKIAYAVGAAPDTAKARVLSREEVAAAINDFGLVVGGFDVPKLRAETSGLNEVMLAGEPRRIELETQPPRPAPVVKIGKAPSTSLDNG